MLIGLPFQTQNQLPNRDSGVKIASAGGVADILVVSISYSYFPAISLLLLLLLLSKYQHMRLAAARSLARRRTFATNSGIASLGTDHGPELNTSVCIRGCISTLRAGTSSLWLVVQDDTQHACVQVVCFRQDLPDSDSFDMMRALKVGSWVDIYGSLVETELPVRACTQSNVEVRAERVVCISPAVSKITQQRLGADHDDADAMEMLRRWNLAPWKGWRRWVSSRQKLTVARGDITSSSSSSEEAACVAELQPPLLRGIANVVGSARCLARKEFFESWEAASRIHQHFRYDFPQVTRVTEVAAGHGLVSWMLLLLGERDGTPRTATCIDVRAPRAAGLLEAAFLERWPHLEGRLVYRLGAWHRSGTADLSDGGGGGGSPLMVDSDTLLIAIHACNTLADEVIEASITARCPVAVMPCCHSLRSSRLRLPPLGGLTPQRLADAAERVGDVDAIDGFRAAALKEHFDVRETAIPRVLSDLNRLLLASPKAPGCA